MPGLVKERGTIFTEIEKKNGCLYHLAVPHCFSFCRLKVFGVLIYRLLGMSVTCIVYGRL